MFTERRSLADRCIRWIRHQSGWLVLRIGLQLRYPELIATGYSLLTINYAPDRPYRALVISKDILQEDIRAISMFTDRVGFVTLAAAAFKTMYNTISKGRMAGLNQQNYHCSDEWDAPKKEYYDLLMQVLPRLQRKLGFKVVMAASWTYISHQELARALQDLRIPFVILYKEGMAVRGREDEQSRIWSSEFFTGPIRVNRILTYNQGIAERILKMRVSGISADMLRPVGPPRLDFYRRLEVSEPTSKLLSFFPFSMLSPFFYFREINDPASREQMLAKIEPIVEEVYRSVVEFARRRPDVDVVMKIKRGSEPVRFSLAMLDRVTECRYELVARNEAAAPGKKINRLMARCEFPDIPNLSLADEWIAMDLIRRSTCVLALNSTTLLEAVALGRRALSPDFSEVFPNAVWHYGQKYPGVCRLVRTAEDLENAIDEPRAIDHSFEQQRERLLRDYCACGMNELSSQAVERELIDVIEQSARQQARSNP